MKVVLALGAVLITLVLVVLVVGWGLPVAHRVSRRVVVATTPEQLFATVVAVEQYPVWRSGVTRVDVLVTDSSRFPKVFREHGSDGAIQFEVVERVPARRFVTRIADPTLPFGGQWTFDVTSADGGAQLEITEDGEVYNPIFRFVSRFVLGHTRTLDQYLGDVVKQFDVGSDAVRTTSSRKR